MGKRAIGMQLWLGIGSTAAGSILAFSFGGWNESLTLLAVLMGVDYISGVLAAVKTGKGLSSGAGFWGLARKGLTLLVILTAHRVDVLLGSSMVMGGAVSFYMANELLSIVENCGRLGLPIPDSIRRLVRVLRDRDADGDGRRKP